MRIPHMILSAAALASLPAAANARNIVLTNDDGLTSNVLALYHALKDAGHDVIVSVPCTNQSGMGAALFIARPLGALDAPCLNDAASAGDPGAGPMTRADLPADDFFYVDGTPVMAMLHGVEIAGKQRWGAEPDLLLSGPNEGQNLGAIVLTSGTVSNAQYAAVRGIPAIALSAGANTESAELDNPLSPEVARLTVQLVGALEAKAGDNPLLPRGMALNVNFPNEMQGAQWQASRIGTYNAYLVGFSMNLAQDATPTIQAMAASRGMEIPPLPAVSFDMNSAPPAPGQENDESIVFRTNISVSPMQAGYEYAPTGQDFLHWQLADLLNHTPENQE